MTDSQPGATPNGRTLVIGEALIDAVTTAEGALEEHVGGSPANVAFGLAALDHEVSLATWLATDDHGNRIAEHCRERGVELTAGSQGAPFTSVAHASLDTKGAATYRFDLEWQLAAVPGLPGFGHVHTGSIAAVLEPGGTAVRDTLRQTRPTATVSYDPNARPTLMGDPHRARRTIEECVALADVVKVSDEDLAWLHPDESVDDVVAKWSDLGPSLIVVTQGADGARATVTRTGETHRAPAPPVTVLDTVGAGDSFMSALLAILCDWDVPTDGPGALDALDEDHVRLLLRGSMRAAAATCSRRGANPPTRRELPTTWPL